MAESVSALGKADAYYNASIKVVPQVNACPLVRAGVFILDATNNLKHVKAVKKTANKNKCLEESK